MIQFADNIFGSNKQDGLSLFYWLVLNHKPWNRVEENKSAEKRDHSREKRRVLLQVIKK